MGPECEKTKRPTLITKARRDLAVRVSSMDQTLNSTRTLGDSTPPVSVPAASHSGLNAAELATLLGQPEAAQAGQDHQFPGGGVQQNDLLQVRLGLASSLFGALRCKPCYVQF